jgi:IS5 family transposase
VQEQLARAGYSARCGQLIDATIVRTPVQHFTRAEKETLERGEIPDDWSAAKRAQKDLDAAWTKKHVKSYFGHKAHANADVRYKLARNAVITPASVHDTNHFEDLLDKTNTGHGVSANKGYADGKREAQLKAEGWRVNIQRKAQRGKPLSDCQRRRNTRIARTRARVEHVFAGLHQMGGLMIRTIGLARAQFQMTTKLAVYNLKRWMSLRRCGMAAF